MASRLTCSGPQWDTSGRGRICWLSCFTKFERKAIKKINFRLCCWTLSGQVTWMRRIDAGAGAAAARPSLLWLCNLFQRQKIAKITKMRNERQTLDVYELSFKTIVADQWIDESTTGGMTYLLNSKRALVEWGTPFSGHERKWNWVTVRVSPVRMFFR